MPPYRHRSHQATVDHISQATHLSAPDMPKRKRDDIGSSEEDPKRSANRALRKQRLQLEGVLSNGAKSLFRALKVARGFERQKLGRRQKAAKQSKDDAEAKRLEVEVATLKVLRSRMTSPKASGFLIG